MSGPVKYLWQSLNDVSKAFEQKDFQNVFFLRGNELTRRFVRNFVYVVADYSLTHVFITKINTILFCLFC